MYFNGTANGKCVEFDRIRMAKIHDMISVAVQGVGCHKPDSERYATVWYHKGSDIARHREVYESTCASSIDSLLPLPRHVLNSSLCTRHGAQQDTAD